ncbi:DUF1054 domain-containing protein [Companilactobacillus alimentarius]|uniref:Uncharacterized protein n=1 Tax=Companilactobacillus alimentarius DSM 20249 TaxID=1423720 RepID=A0A2K9HEH9_9LACO|nr:DUF1054 family protein [Companilactobacillus alimentarius]AUI70959.1 hypothetical protein LA20249_01545 [Companilactobacillus alimentarius DSM 20249]KRK75074.1 hypothetical protein FC67_GL001584 [Companilactobacillus alimentarius DSM 20249]MDT6951791.1 DUF1054 family protein [Companilactobacillus alimentarius]GEO44153.1 UPF0637 protein [Companilactobacillus alimentarius]
MFDKKDFQVFNDDTLSGRLNLIRSDLDPKFEILGQELLQSLEKEYHQKFFLKIAKHQRRTKNPPPDTWLAINQDKKGYKKTPHLEFGLWPDRYFITFSLLADIRQRGDYYPILEKYQNEIIKDGWGVSNNHTSSEMKPASDFKQVISHYQKVKSSDLVIGFELKQNDPIVIAGDYDRLLKDKFMNLSKYLVLFNEEVAK